MGVLDIFSKRKNRADNQGRVDPYVYDKIPSAFRTQVIHIWVDAIGQPIRKQYYDYGPEPAANKAWPVIHDALARELGTFSLSEKGNNHFDKCQHFLHSAEIDNVLDIIELSFRFIDRGVRDIAPQERKSLGISVSPDEAIEELNQRFREHSIGYQFVNGHVIRVDSQYIHSEVVRPALSLLWQEGFNGPAQEFLEAHEHYREGRYKEALVSAQKSFESAMKAICDTRGWSLRPNDSE